jgi:hypothetical protein
MSEPAHDAAPMFVGWISSFVLKTRGPLALDVVFPRVVIADGTMSVCQLTCGGCPRREASTSAGLRPLRFSPIPKSATRLIVHSIANKVCFQGDANFGDQLI